MELTKDKSDVDIPLDHTIPRPANAKEANSWLPAKYTDMWLRSYGFKPLPFETWHDRDIQRWKNPHTQQEALNHITFNERTHDMLGMIEYDPD